MKAGRLIRSVCWEGIFIAAIAGIPAHAQTSQQPEAGKITTLIPTGSVLREKKTLEAKKDMSVLWQDTVKTDRGGRARIRLSDGSVLNVGSQASMVITKHDPGKQQTELELIYGKVRADVSKISTPDGHFEIRTKVAVCGVVGTLEYVETSPLTTTVMALGGGQVRVGSLDPAFPAEVFLNPGEMVSVISGRGVGAKRQASATEMLHATQETEGESGATIEPGVSVAGKSFDAIITGKDLSGSRAVSFSQPGLTIRPRGEASSTQIPVTITVDAGVPVGAYPITIDRPQGPAVAGFAVTTASAIAPAATAGPIQLPPVEDYTVTRGAKIPFDASGARTPAGTQVVAYQWSVANTTQTASGQTFSVNTSLLQPGTYTVQLTVINDQGTVATQQYPLVVEAGVQPVEIVRDMASAYESLQPAAFLKNFDEERFRNYAGFAGAVENSFRSKLESMRVFQRPVNCAVVEQQDQSVCQAEFQLQFTLKDQPLELLDASGNPIPPGTTPPPNATMGKQVLKGSEQDTIRFERANKGWKVTDYAAVVSCPGGSTTSGINVGSCVFALGSLATPSFQLTNVSVSSTDLPVGGSISGSLTVVPVGGYTGSIAFTAQGQAGNQPITTTFTPNPSGPSANVSFTIFGPATPPAGGGGATPFTLVITGHDTTGSISVSTNLNLSIQPDFNLVLTPATTSTAPQPVTQNSTLPVTVQVVAAAGFTGTVLIDFPNIPPGFSADAGNVAIGGQATFPLTVGSNAAPGPALITVRGRLSSGTVKTATLFLNVTSDFTLSVTPPSSQANPIQISNLAPLVLNVQVVPAFGFTGTVNIDFPNLPTGLTATPGPVAAGATVPFTIQTSQLPVGPPSNATITVRGTFGNDVQTILVFVQISIAIPIVPGPPLAQASVLAVDPVKLKPGEVVTGTLYGKNLGSVTSVEVSGSGIKAELLEATPTELHVRFTADASVDAGSRMLTLRSKGNKAATAAIDVAPGSRPARVPVPSPTRIVTGAESDKPEDSTPSAVHTIPAPASNVEKLNSKQVSESADSVTSRTEPLASRPAQQFGPRQKGDLRVVLNGCTGFRLTSGAEQSCGGSADIEISSHGASLIIGADGVQNLGAASLDQTQNIAMDGMATSATLQPGSAYLIKVRHGLAIVRVVQARGLESLRNAPPAALRGPKISGADREPLGGSTPSVTLVLEWKTLQQ
jgi:hypothetical protein